MKKELKTTLMVLGCSALSALGAVGLYRAQSISSHSYGEGGTPAEAFGQARMTPAAYAQGGVPDDFVEAAERSINGVVNIRSEKEVRQQERFIDPFEFFFGMPSQRDQQPREMPKAIGIGSGVIISEDGYIMTNNHVVEGVDKLYVTTNDNVEHEATVIGSDPNTDIALIKITAKGLRPIPFGDSDHVRVGEWVLAIGNPFNLSSTVTAGIVSAIGRGTAGGKNNMQISSFIQTDAAVNPGSSGGALVNTRGELIGINTMIYSQTGNYAGYSFAVPVNIAAKVVADIKQYGTVQRAVLGIMGGNINADAIKEFGLKVSEGALVAEVNDGSAAKMAGVKAGDVITAIGSTPIRTMSQLQENIAVHRPGDQVEVTINRKGEVLKKTLTLRNNSGTTGRVEKASASAIGAAFIKVDDKTKEKFGISYGVEVAGVSDGKFKEAGIRKGFIVLSINNYKVSTPKEAEEIIQMVMESGPDKVLFIKGIQPNGDIKYVAVDLR